MLQQARGDTTLGPVFCSSLFGSIRGIAYVLSDESWFFSGWVLVCLLGWFVLLIVVWSFWSWLGWQVLGHMKVAGLVIHPIAAR